MTEVLPTDKELTVNDVQRAISDPSVRLIGRMTSAALRPFLRVNGSCEFSEAMAEGTDSWINRAYVYLDFGEVDLGGATDLEDAKARLKVSLTTREIANMIEDAGDMDVALDEDRGISFGF